MASKKPAVPRQRKPTEKKPAFDEDDWGAEDHVPDTPGVFEEYKRRYTENEAMRKAEEAQKVKDTIQQQEAEEKAHAERVLRELEEAVQAKKAEKSTGRARRGTNTGNMPGQTHFEAMRACLGRM